MVLGLVAPVAGVGLVYLLREADIAGAGRAVAGALPLEQLAGADAQPLLRILLAWVPVGLAAGAVLAAFTRTVPAVTLLVMAVAAGIVLVVSGGISDALANNEPLTRHLGTPLGDAGTWLAIGILVMSAAVAEGLARAAVRAPSAT